MITNFFRDGDKEGFHQFVVIYMVHYKSPSFYTSFSIAFPFCNLFLPNSFFIAKNDFSKAALLIHLFITKILPRVALPTKLQSSTVYYLFVPFPTRLLLPFSPPKLIFSFFLSIKYFFLSHFSAFI